MHFQTYLAGFTIGIFTLANAGPIVEARKLNNHPALSWKNSYCLRAELKLISR